MTGVDLLCISAHTDDAEIGLGATLRLLSDAGRRVWICDLTRGELGSNASPDERWREAQQASQVLGVAGRLQLDLGDGFVTEHDRRQASSVTAVIRLLRPRWVVTAPDPHRHPDHVAVGPLVARACHLARLRAFAVQLPAACWWPEAGATENSADTASAAAGELAERWEVEARLEVCPDGQVPSLLFDCSATWAAKREALACYASQFQRRPGRHRTRINDAGFLEKIERRGREWGLRAGVEYAEALRSSAAPVVTDLPRETWS